MTSGGNNINYFPDNQLTKFIAVHPLKFQWSNVRHSPVGWTPLVQRFWQSEEWMVSFTTDTRRPYHSVDHSPNDVIGSVCLFAGRW